LKNREGGAVETFFPGGLNVFDKSLYKF